MITNIEFANLVQAGKFSSGPRYASEQYLQEESSIVLSENGYLHSVNGPAYVSADGLTKIWAIHGYIHNFDGPAFTNGTQTCWGVFNRDHRLDGPAFIDINSGEQEWWVDGIKYKSYLEYTVAVEKYKQKQLTLA